MKRNYFVHTIIVLIFIVSSCSKNDQATTNQKEQKMNIRVKSKEKKPNENQSKPQVKLRSSYKYLSVNQVQSIPHISIRDIKELGFLGHSTIDHYYEVKTIYGNKVVIDHATGLMWHQSGSKEWMGWDEVQEWVRNLNRKDYAGYSNWRLPTVEEAASLLDSSKKKYSGLYIDTVFDKHQNTIRTGDKNFSQSVWFVNFDVGCVLWLPIYSNTYVRPVRSVKLE